MSPKKTLARKKMEEEITYTFQIEKNINTLEFGILFDSDKVVHFLDTGSHASEILRKNDKIIAINGIRCNTFHDIKVLAKYTANSAIFSIYRDLSI